MRTDLHQSKLLFTGVVVSGGSLILLRIVRTLLVGVLVSWMNKLPWVLQQQGKVLFFSLLITQVMQDHFNIDLITRSDIKCIFKWGHCFCSSTKKKQICGPLPLPWREHSTGRAAACPAGPNQTASCTQNQSSGPPAALIQSQPT